MQNFYKKGRPAQTGIALAELLIIFAVIAILVSVILPQFSKIRENQTLKSGAGDVLSAINKARSQALASIDSSEYGVHFQSDGVIIFKGTVFSALAGDNEIINLTTPVTISNVTLLGVSGTSGDVYFDRLSGAPSKNGTITLSTSSLSKIITISATGVPSLN
ncbi:hypothetical protein A3A95_01600 [Candidatus Nomurabacteria bacterium RIFCSPLOWO2_01_FULL_39_18]|uniref:General secretion pathway GspH domain-containing protein n=1 Tax=Candidatus Nomurabacteria bacterium RIFCSPHIGHO2_01_FULL_40_24b TaxID=1801739 RepID=A0A1F6V826_9BACT|nr:MAG: hypothetical protein A2647_00090 [Candidatus Nomurabacteria bacterium RIFCSPHIGHO2_01_FULL_40_24b]OGI88982.1 MAG: hypothetical protein A3A95_01600 [Candidatus Nomurabacteria bacterium RIFCSPLOWO2_01_FULL_39_18]